MFIVKIIRWVPVLTVKVAENNTQVLTLNTFKKLKQTVIILYTNVL